VVEVGASSLSDDLERKQLLYKRLGVQEYWWMLLLDKLLLLEYPEARAAEFKHPKYYQVWESPD